MMLGPLSALASRYRVPSWLSASLLMILLVGLVSLVITLLSAPLVEWIGKAPDIGNMIRDKLQVFDRPLAALRDIRNALLPSGKDGGLQIDLASTLVAPDRQSVV